MPSHIEREIDVQSRFPNKARKVVKIVVSQEKVLKQREESKLTCKRKSTLAPGLTASCNHRIFINHNTYTDMSCVLPTAEEKQVIVVERQKYLTNPKNIRFPHKVYRALQETVKLGKENVFAWLAHGRAFKIHDYSRFSKEILPALLGMSNYDSFLRQLSIYGFKRLTKAGSGRSSSRALYHHLFLRGREHLLLKMKRSPFKGTKIRPAANTDDEPDFFAMRHCTNFMIPEIFEVTALKTKVENLQVVTVEP